MAIANDTDRDWELWATTNPYFGVLSDPKYLDTNLNDDSLAEFFASGEDHVEHIYRVIRTRIQPDFKASRVLDYGCGVGRVVIPFARRSPEAVGVDVSDTMLELARKNCQKSGVASVRLLNVKELDSLAPGSFDLIHCFITFQHIAVARGEPILQKLIALISAGGVGAIQLPFNDSRSALRRAVLTLRRRVNLVHGLLNLAMGKRYSSPQMQGNFYSLNRIFGLLIEAGCPDIYVEGLSHDHLHSATVYFQKSGRPGLPNGNPDR